MTNGHAIVCGTKKDHDCNEDGRVFGTRDGVRHFFKTDAEGRQWEEENYTNVIMGSVACSICGGAAIDNAYKL